MDPFILPDQPSGEGTPYIIDAGDLSGTDEIFLDEPDAVLDRTLTFRIMFVAYPELQLLFCTEIFKDTGLYDFTESFTGNEHRILIDDQNGRPAAKPAEAPVDRLTGLCGIIFRSCAYTQRSLE